MGLLGLWLLVKRQCASQASLVRAGQLALSKFVVESAFHPISGPLPRLILAKAKVPRVHTLSGHNVHKVRN
jgi:hypothetical protein